MLSLFNYIYCHWEEATNLGEPCNIQLCIYTLLIPAYLFMCSVSEFQMKLKVSGR